MFIFQRKILERVPGLNGYLQELIHWDGGMKRLKEPTSLVGLVEDHATGDDPLMGRLCYRCFFWVGGVADGSRKIKPPVVSLLFLVIWLCQFLS